MCTKTLLRKNHFLSLLLIFISFLSAVIIPFNATAQNDERVANKIATCRMKVNNKDYELKANVGGYFPRITNVQPNAVIPIKILYPAGKAGEKVVVSVVDGGQLDNGKTVKVVQLDSQKQCVFNFQTSNNLGLFRLLLYKGDDEKIVQIWVGAEPILVKE